MCSSMVELSPQAFLHFQLKASEDCLAVISLQTRKVSYGLVAHIFQGMFVSEAIVRVPQHQEPWEGGPGFSTR